MSETWPCSGTDRHAPECVGCGSIPEDYDDRLDDQDDDDRSDEDCWDCGGEGYVPADCGEDCCPHNGPGDGPRAGAVLDVPGEGMNHDKVGIFEHQRKRSISLVAYTNWYNGAWRGCCEHAVTVSQRREAKAVALAEHRARCMGNRK